MLLMLWILWSSVYSLASFCPSVGHCVYGGSDGANIIYTVHSTSTGWFGFGLGSQMAGSIVYMGWTNSTGGVTLSVRHFTARMYAFSSTLSNPTLTDLKIPAPVGANIAFSFSRPISEVGSTVSSGSSYVWGLSGTPPLQIDNDQSEFVQHDERGIVGAVDFTPLGFSSSVTPTPVPNSLGISSPVLSLPSGKVYSDILFIHGLLMVIAWGICAPFGIIVARFLKSVLGVWWFRLHTIFMASAGGLTIGGIIYLYLYKTPPHFVTFHPILGLVLGILILIQFVFGYLSDFWFDPNRETVPLIDKVHWSLGRVLFIGSIVQIILGFLLIQSEFGNLPGILPVMYGIGLGLGTLVFLYLSISIGQVHHVRNGFFSSKQQPVQVVTPTSVPNPRDVEVLAIM